MRSVSFTETGFTEGVSRGIEGVSIKKKAKKVLKVH